MRSMVAGEIPLLVDSDANEVILASFILALMASGFNREGILMGFLSNECLRDLASGYMMRLPEGSVPSYESKAEEESAHQIPGRQKHRSFPHKSSLLTMGTVVRIISA